MYQGTTVQPPCSHAHISGLPLVLVTAFRDESVVDAGLLPADIHAAVEPLGGETCVSDAGTFTMGTCIAG